MINANIVVLLIRLLDRDVAEVRREAAWALANATNGGTGQQIQYMVHRGCLPPLCSLLAASDLRMVNVAMEALENILAAGDRFAESNGVENPFISPALAAGAGDDLYRLQFIKSKALSSKAIALMRAYFSEDDDVGADDDAGASNVIPPGESAPGATYSQAAATAGSVAALGASTASVPTGPSAGYAGGALGAAPLAPAVDASGQYVFGSGPASSASLLGAASWPGMPAPGAPLPGTNGAGVPNPLQAAPPAWPAAPSGQPQSQLAPSGTMQWGGSAGQINWQ